MTAWITSDLHLLDPWASGLRFGRRNLPDAVQWNSDRIARAWDDVVEPGDVVYLLGDITTQEDIGPAEKWLCSRPGDKMLILGNWDVSKGWESSTAVSEWFDNLVYDHGSVVYTMSHYPELGDLYGHTHRKTRFDERYPTKLHVGWDAWRRIVPLSEALQALESLRADQKASRTGTAS